MSTGTFTKNKLSLALATAFVGGMTVSSPSSAVDLDNTDRLGDAALFSYYTANGDWQTFFRIINTEDDAVLVKVRFREAANSREVLDFEVALSPHDMWTGWTDKNALGNGVPGIRTNDHSCLFPLPDANPIPGEGFKTIDAATHLLGAEFEDRAFNEEYDDGAGKTSLERMSEGYFEVIGVAEYDCEGSDRENEFCQAVMHDDSGFPESCVSAYNRIYGNEAIASVDDNNARGDDFPNSMAANAYLVNVPSGQGAGYDPDIFVDCHYRSMERDLIATDTRPDFDDCAAGIYGQHIDEYIRTAVNQRLWDGSEPPTTSESETRYWADINTAAFDASGNLVSVGNGDFDQSNLQVDLNGDGDCNDASETGISEMNVPQDLYDAAQADGQLNVFTNAGSCFLQIVDSGGNVTDPITVLTNSEEITYERPTAWRIKQKGKQLNFWREPHVNQWYVEGGVDDVSRELIRTSVINEWAASYNPESIVTDYFTQWVLTFPTKHYYVDLQDDPSNITIFEDISPTLVDPQVGPDGNDAFSPFSQEFGEGGSCEPIAVQMYNREERFSQFQSPQPPVGAGLCWETNVVNFAERYADRGLASNFAVTIPEAWFPTDADTGEISERGWAQMWFTGFAATHVGLGHEWRNYYGLPVTGFLFSVYNTVSPNQNHTTINSHAYTRDWERCRRSESPLEGDGVALTDPQCPTIYEGNDG